MKDEKKSESKSSAATFSGENNGFVRRPEVDVVLKVMITLAGDIAARGGELTG